MAVRRVICRCPLYDRPGGQCIHRKLPVIGSVYLELSHTSDIKRKGFSKWQSHYIVWMPSKSNFCITRSFFRSPGVRVTVSLLYTWHRPCRTETDTWPATTWQGRGVTPPVARCFGNAPWRTSDTRGYQYGRDGQDLDDALECGQWSNRVWHRQNSIIHPHARAKPKRMENYTKNAKWKEKKMEFESNHWSRFLWALTGLLDIVWFHVVRSGHWRVRLMQKLIKRLAGGFIN